MRELSAEQLANAVQTHNEKVLKIVSTVQRWTPEKLVAMCNEFGDLTKRWLLDNGHGVEVLTRDEKILHAIVLSDQLLSLSALSNH